MIVGKRFFPTVTNFPYCRILSPSVTNFPVLSQTFPHCHQLSPTVTNFPYCYQLLLNTTIFKNLNHFGCLDFSKFQNLTPTPLPRLLDFSNIHPDLVTPTWLPRLEKSRGKKSRGKKNTLPLLLVGFLSLILMKKFTTF